MGITAYLSENAGAANDFGGCFAVLHMVLACFARTMPSFCKE